MLVTLLPSSFIFPRDPETVRVQFADRAKLTEALLILHTSWLKKLNQQKTINFYLVGLVFLLIELLGVIV